MDQIKRLLNIELPPGQSAFLWGPKKTGKTTYLKNKFPKSIVFDFLNTDLYLEFCPSIRAIDGQGEKCLTASYYS